MGVSGSYTLDLSSKRILITGGAGFLGSHIVDRLARMGCKQVAVPRRKDFDLVRTDAMERLFEETRPEVVIHAAAAVGGIAANRDNPGRFFYENAMMGVHLIEMCRRFQVQKTIVVGTICGYPEFTKVPFREETFWDGYPEETNAPYGLAKKMLLVQCQAYRKQYGMQSIFLLPANLYGPRDHFEEQTSHVVPALIRKFLEGRRAGSESVTLWGDGSPTRDFLFVEDAADAVVTATERYQGIEPVNIGTGREVSIRELANTLAKLIGFSGRIEWDEAKPNGQLRRSLDVGRAEREFGFRARTPLETGLALTLDWYRARRVEAEPEVNVGGRPGLEF
jgi:GDP-L-fucose synthase